MRLGFSKAAVTLSLSFNCLLIAASDAWLPFATSMSTFVFLDSRFVSFDHQIHSSNLDKQNSDRTLSKLEPVTVTLNRGWRTLSSFTRMERPINVAILQCSTVGVNWILHHNTFKMACGEQILEVDLGCERFAQSFQTWQAPSHHQLVRALLLPHSAVQGSRDAQDPLCHECGRRFRVDRWGLESHRHPVWVSGPVTVGSPSQNCSLCRWSSSWARPTCFRRDWVVSWMTGLGFMSSDWRLITERLECWLMGFACGDCIYIRQMQIMWQISCQADLFDLA